MKKIMALLSVLILTVSTLTVYAADIPNSNVTLEEKVAVLKSINGGDYSASSEPMTMIELFDILINSYNLDEKYVKAIGDGNVYDPAGYDNAFFDFGGGGDPNTPVQASKTVNPTLSKVFANGVEQSFEAYNIDGSNYFKLRDIAFVLNGTSKPFEVGYDNSTNAVTVTSGQQYTPTGGEMAAGDGQAKPAAPTA